ncbi:hypothetical protein [Natronococcus occultus]|uniref:DUF4386 family protein n=1 Tax=Natronococcus occultus SP4 TaxID=694430 RepID=L0K3N2_9EURY|nr:hypothetical protein [Natronococcus occultus]AGB38713.1 hypothetical protein Natoc_2958 [Natronococcus occultus SP4]
MSAWEDDGAAASLARTAVLVGTPIALGAVLWVHPHGGAYETVAAVADAWLAVHLLLLPLFALLGAAVYVLLAGFSGRTATIGRLGVAVYVIFYIGFEAIAGIATGLVVRGTGSLSGAEQVGAAAAYDAIVTSPVVGVLALLGIAGMIVAVVALALELRRAGAPTVPIVLLAGVPIAVVGHGGGSIDAVGMALFLVGVVWLEFGWHRESTHHEGVPA